MYTYLKPIIALIVLSPFLAEVLTGNTPITLFLHPVVFLLFVTAGYGFPVLIIRELFVRKKLHFYSLFLLGIIYGLWNEGLFAQTLFYPFHSPLESFGTYGLIGNVRIPFTLVISVWHAFYAVIYPIVVVHYFFPSYAHTPWISKKAAWILGLASFAFGAVGFFWNVRESEFATLPGSFAGNPYHFAFLLLIGTILFFLARWISAKEVPTPKNNSTKKLFFYGVLWLCAILILPTLYAGLSLPTFGLYGYFAFLFFYAWRYFAFFSSLSVHERMIIVCGGEAALTTLGALISFFIQAQVLQGALVASCLCLFLILTLILHRQRLR